MKSSEEIIAKMNSALEEVIAMGYVVYQTGNFNKAKGLITAAQFISNALGDDCSPGLLDRYRKLDEMLQGTQTCCDFVI